MSRGTSSVGTALMQPINHNKITKGINGDLRQELRELELLAYITELTYEKKLPKEINGCTHNELIYKFRKWKGKKFVPPQISPELGWEFHLYKNCIRRQNGK